MRTALIGYTGFIGGNLARQFSFDDLYNSTNISAIRGQAFDLVICGGITAVKWWANQHAREDLERIDSLLDNLRRVHAAKFVVLSTVDVYPTLQGVDEAFDCHSLSNHAYGTNRLHFEDAMKDCTGSVTIVRIPTVFGHGLKKNLIYNLLHDNDLDGENPSSSFQYYDIANLWRDLQAVDLAGIRLMNLVSEPIPTRDIVNRLFAGKQVGSKAAPPQHYDIRTLHAAALGAIPPYIASKEQIFVELAEFLLRRGTST